MNRFEQRYSDYKSALKKLEIALKENIEKLNENQKQIIIDGVLHRFEFTFELAWKTMKDYLEYMGITQKIGSPRENIQEAFKEGIIDNGEIWIAIMLSRNELSHLYDEQASREIYNKIKEKFIFEFIKLQEKFEKILKGDE